MATSRTPKEFARRMELIAEKVKENTLKNVKRAAIAADQTAVLKTPVDTGRARANWYIGIGVPFFEENPLLGGNRSQAANLSLERARDSIDKYRLGQGGIFITNSVPYAPLLDAGSSAQAPAGMTAAAIKAAQTQLGSAKLLDGV